MFNIIKDFAMVDRREYLPYCPICGEFFQTSVDLWMLKCNHFFCARCVTYFKLDTGVFGCPFDGERSEGIRSGEFLGESIQFLAEWAKLVSTFSEENLIDRLLSDIILLRSKLNFESVPCRITASGTLCNGAFMCRHDHTLKFYRKRPCPNYDCPNKDCMFMNALQAPAPILTGMQGLGAAPVRETKSSSCCSLV